MILLERSFITEIFYIIYTYVLTFDSQDAISGGFGSRISID